MGTSEMWVTSSMWGHRSPTGLVGSCPQGPTSVVDLAKAYSNPAEHVNRLRSLLELPRAERPAEAPVRRTQQQNRLGPHQVADLVAAYKAGERVGRLAVQFGVHRQTVRTLLREVGVWRRVGIQPENIPELARLYDSGWSLARLAARFEVAPSTVNSTLRRLGVPIRQPGRPRRSPPPSPMAANADAR